MALRPRRIPLFSLGLLAIIWGLGAGAGCSSFSYNEPPTAAAARLPEKSVPAANQSVVIGALANPSHAPVAWVDIGPGMSAALAASLRNRAGIDAWVDAALVSHVQAVLREPPEKRRRGLERLREQLGPTRVLVTGQVTDFAHTDDLPESVQRSGVFGRKREAIVAVRLDFIDLETGHVVRSDHVHGTADAPKTAAREIYREMAFGSYVFWNSPLGRASEVTIVEATDAVARALPKEPEPMAIASRAGPNGVRLVRPVATAGLERRTFRVCLVDERTGRHRSVRDADTGQPLRARLDVSAAMTSTASLLGETPRDADLVGAVLCPGSDPSAPAVAGVPR